MFDISLELSTIEPSTLFVLKVFCFKSLTLEILLIFFFLHLIETN
jgi:hypothetical protein